MENLVFVIVLLAAFLHAIWNGMVKNHPDKFVAVGSIIFGHVPLSILAVLLFPMPKAESIPYIVVSIFIHQGYQWFLINSYQVGDLTKVYPIARGSAPLITTLISILILGLVLDILIIICIFTICFGIMLISLFDDAQKNLKVIFYPLITGFFIASYSIVDGYGARVSESALSFVSWSFLINAAIFPLVLKLRGENNIFQRVYKNGKKIFFAGIFFSYASYALVVWAFTKAPIPIVGALRETSILFTMLIGYFFLKEKITAIKIFSILMILSGVIALKLL